MIIKFHPFRVPFFLLLLLVVCLVVPAQVSDREKNEKEAERKQQLERKTYSLVEEIAGGALSLKLPENRAFVLAAAADLLWDHDQARARNLFWDALNAVNLMNSSITGDPALGAKAKPSAKEKERILREYINVFGLRHELLRRVAPRDPQFALEMLRSSQQLVIEARPEWMGQSWLPEDRELEQQIASASAERDPQKALQLARESLANGFSFQLFELLFRLNQKDTKLGTQFAGDIIDKLRPSDISTNAQAASIAVSLLTSSRAPADEPVAKLVASPELRRLSLDKEQRRKLIEMITDAALTESANGNLLFDLPEVMTEIREFTPERQALLDRKLAAFTQTLNPEQKTSQEQNAFFRSGSPEEMLKIASKASGAKRSWMQQHAAIMAVMRGRADSLRDFANNEITDESQRKNVIEALDAEQLNLAIAKSDSETLQKLLPKIRRREERARAMVETAVMLEKKGKHDDAVKLLDEAQLLIKTDLTSETQTNALLALVGAYALVEPAKAFGLIERTIDHANDDLAKLLLLDKIVRSGMIKNGEIRMQDSGMMPLDFAVFKYGKSVAALANADFDRTRAAADRFERNELRLMARLLLAQALLRRNEPPMQAEAR